MFNNHLKVNKEKTTITWGIFGPGLIIPEAFGLLIILGFVLNIFQYGFEVRYIAPLIVGLFITTVAFQRDYWVFDNKTKIITHKTGIFPFAKAKESINYDDVDILEVRHFQNNKGKAMMSFYLILSNGEKIAIEEVQESVSKGKIERAANSISLFTDLSYDNDRPIEEKNKAKGNLNNKSL